MNVQVTLCLYQINISIKINILKINMKNVLLISKFKRLDIKTYKDRENAYTIDKTLMHADTQNILKSICLYC